MSNLNSADIRTLIAKCEAEVAQTGQKLAEADTAYKLAVREALLTGAPDAPAQAAALAATNADHRATDRLQTARQLLVEALAAEKEAADAESRALIIDILKLLDAEAEKIDALSVELARRLVEMRKIAYTAQPILRTNMGREAPNPGLVIEVAPRISTFIRASTGGNPMDHEPVAKVIADKYAAQVRTAAGIVSDE